MTVKVLPYFVAKSDLQIPWQRERRSKMETFTKLHFSKQFYSWACFDKLSLRFVFRVTTKWNWSFQFQRNSAMIILIVDGSVKKSLIKLTQTFDSQKQMMFCKWLIALFHPSLTNIECNTTLDILASLLCPPNKEDWKLWCVCTIVYEKVSDVPKSRVCHTQYGLPAKIWRLVGCTDFLIGQIIAKCHSFPNMNDTL